MYARPPIRTDPARGPIGRLTLGLALFAWLIGPPAVSAQDESASPGDDSVPTASNVPDRAMTPREIRRELDFTQRELEDLLERIGDNDPNPSQREKLRDLLARLGQLNTQLQAAEKRYDEKVEDAAGSFKRKWMQLRRSLDDFSNYDIRNGMFRIDVGVRFQLDATFVREDRGIQATVGSIQNSLRARRGRVFARGRLFRRLDFALEYDFAADAGLKDAYIEGSKFTKRFKWRIGHFKEPFSMSRQSSAFNLPNLEWPLPVPAFAPGRNWGLMFLHQGTPRRLTWAFSLTTNGKVTDDNRSDSRITFTGRATGLPIYRDDGRRLLHLGGSITFRDPAGNVVRFSARPEARFVPFFVDTPQIEGSATTAWGLEVATVVDQLWAQAEWIQSEVVSDPSNLTFAGGYVEAGWFLTGEYRHYSLNNGVFGRLTPNRLFHGGNPFTGKGDGGAIELTARFSTVNLDDGPVRGGLARDVGLGLNWYLSQATRFMFNYVHSEVVDTGHADIALIRFQFNP